MVSRNKEIQQMLTEFKRICDCFGHFDIIQDFRIPDPGSRSFKMIKSMDPSRTFKIKRKRLSRNLTKIFVQNNFFVL